MIHSPLAESPSRSALYVARIRTQWGAFAVDAHSHGKGTWLLNRTCTVGPWTPIGRALLPCWREPFESISQGPTPLWPCLLQAQAKRPWLAGRSNTNTVATRCGILILFRSLTTAKAARCSEDVRILRCPGDVYLTSSKREKMPSSWFFSSTL
ncbi:hypothetical protein ZHAS_00016994 [Anopheles sinensis]|uniref:Uncharacterized protein n=1 Tax=Anopheles sinensis TaxID=74873 RepID=A0A084WFJ5_ANOSI|nr:hypothetical protein ZHAS_00016994 [Anopheles sinensis]